MTDQPSKKYEFVEGDTIEHQGRTLKRIRAIRDFDEVEKGDLGGYIEKEENLSHDGNCWVYQDAKVYDKAKVYENAFAQDDAELKDSAKAYGRAEISGGALICDTAKIFDNAVALGNIIISGDSALSGTAIAVGYENRDDDYIFI